MVQLIDRPGTFRGKLLDWGVSESRGGFPQFVARFAALEYWDEEANQYMPWAEYGQEMQGYFVLYGKDEKGAWKELLNAKQIKEALGWDGLSFESLANGDYSETLVLFRVEDSEYNGNRSLKVSWIDKADANPVRQLPKYDTQKLRALTAKMGGALVVTAAPVTPAKAPTAPAKAPPKRGPGRPKSTPAASPVPTPEVQPDAPSTATPPPAGPAPVPTAPSGSPRPAPTTPETKDSAWAAVNEMKGPSITDEKLAEVWVAEATKIGKAEDQFTPEDWATVKTAVQNQTATF